MEAFLPGWHLTPYILNLSVSSPPHTSVLGTVGQVHVSPADVAGVRNCGWWRLGAEVFLGAVSALEGLQSFSICGGD